jgi:hypothetical protein
MAIISVIVQCKNNADYSMVHFKGTRTGNVVRKKDSVPVLNTEIEDLALVPGDDFDII